MAPAQTFAHAVVSAGPFVALWWLFLLSIILVLPFALVYVPWRVLRDLRRIAVALEKTNRAELDAAREHWVGAITKSAPPERGVANSMFGR